MEDAYFFSPIVTQPVVSGPITYRPENVLRDIENLREAIAGREVTEVFMPVVAPARASRSGSPMSTTPATTS